MSTINISLPAEQVIFIDRLVTRYGFANRSEFIRGLVRLIRHKPAIIQETATFPFFPAPPNQSVNAIMTDFRNTKKYSKAFLKDLEAGLKQSSYFKP
ncbi:ribbon-helix-helix domain-containing protein [Patescibacteria group bacterium]|nr:ribbon-helix-helix domain-containing protein [Patescibacteria group bacterium]MBU1472371.1 ribbon-helix-helix domain-containing protein [Patescibacteria group bacterium]MBU2459892.1 ribbon-helix-helix domain-containing protein [Patescibacteria group bacterium]MBU2544731.1 ribbon-helix-helix domain-containing protein [Patescibacteria group bacterium]